MRSFHFLAILLILLPGPALFSGVAENESRGQETICYCTAAGSTPDGVVALDNNRQILIALTREATAEQLKLQGVPSSQSQLLLLENWGLISTNDGKKYRTAVPVLDRAQTEHLRRQSLELARQLLPAIQPDVVSLTSLLEKSGRKKNAFTILFSYVMDGLVWQHFEEKGAIRKQELTAKEPFWSGEFWILDSKRDFACGTNSISGGGYQMAINWSERTIKNMKLLTDWKMLDKLFTDIKQKQKIENLDALRAFGPYNLFDASGNITIPIIREKKGTELYDQCYRLSQRIAEDVLQKTPLDPLVQQYGLRDKQQALVIVYHEMMWDLLDEMAGTGVISLPKALARPDETNPSDIGDLVFLVVAAEKT